MKNIVAIRTPEHVQIPFATAGIATRAMAKLIDLFFILAFMIPLSLVSAIFMEAIGMGGGRWASGVAAVVIILHSFMPLAYFIGLESWMKGQTFGKKIMGIRVIRDTGGHPGWMPILLRNIMLVADALPISFASGIMSMFAHPQEKRLGDMVAGTWVVEEKQNRGRQALGITPISPKEKEMLGALPPLPPPKQQVLELFLKRRNDLDPEVRSRLVRRMLDRWWPQVVPRQGHEETFLEKAYLHCRTWQKN